MGDRTVGEIVDGLAISIGEKIELGQYVHFDGPVVAYLHKRAADLPPAVGVLVEYGETDHLFTRPDDPRTEAYVTGRFG